MKIDMLRQQWSRTTPPRRRICYAMAFTSCGPDKGMCGIGYYISFMAGTSLFWRTPDQEDQVPPVDIERALKRKTAVCRQPQEHTYEEPTD